MINDHNSRTTQEYWELRERASKAALGLYESGGLVGRRVRLRADVATGPKSRWRTVKRILPGQVIVLETKAHGYVVWGIEDIAELEEK